MDRWMFEDCEITQTVSPTDNRIANEAVGAGQCIGKRKLCATEGDGETKKPLRQPREIVDSLQLSTLISSYNVHFAAYSEGRIKVTQVIPNVVWKLVYADYMKAFPESTLKEFNLKDRVRETLAELKTGNSNEVNSNTTALQSSSVLSSLKLTDGHAKQNILSHRVKIIENTATKIPASKLTAPKNDSDSSPSEVVSVRKSKHSMLSEQVEAISSISLSLETSVSRKSELAAAKLNQIKLSSLKELRDLGVIGEEEFCAKARDLFQI